MTGTFGSWGKNIFLENIRGGALMTSYNIVAETNISTVVSEYIPEQRRRKEYQSEAELEQELIENLGSQGIPYLNIHNEKDLIFNLRKQLEKLNKYQFTDNEWNWFFSHVISNPNNGIREKTRLIQQDNIQTLNCEDGSIRNIRLIDKKNVQSNYVQVINQYEVEGTYKNRYDVTLLVNGLPMVHIELKRRGVAIREAFNQINRYQRDSFWAGSGLYEYVQIFVISNGTNTKYYSNTTRDAHIKDMNKASNQSKQKTSNSFKFTSYWADAKNKTIPDLVDFTRTFFSKHTLLNVLTKYCVFTCDEILMVMRPYQIVATERILNRILITSNYHKEGTLEAGGYIWHTTGSGKTLTSFKTAQLATEFADVDKVLFVVDRKDLDYQTMKEYDKFQKGAANGNTSTRVLQRQLEDEQSRIIVTTIQKLSTFISKNKNHPVYQKHVVLIFDECHRSQFGEMHTRIIKNFKKYHIFGFTGTPIFAQNSIGGKNPNLKTTSQAFGERLHTYTIVDAINDDNVLPFRIDYINTMKKKEISDQKVQAIDTKKAIQDPQRIHDVVAYILEHFDQKTRRRGQSYEYKVLENVKEVAKNKRIKEQKKTHRLSGFNSIFAIESIPLLMRYYDEFKKQMETSRRDLTIATIFSFNPNEEQPESDGNLPDESMDTNGLDKPSRDFLEAAIDDYNKKFHTQYNTSSEEFQNYYKDLSLRMKNREIDILLVVNMFLTGFDATTLNTLWVDKNLRMHGLIQAFSRTNRILNSVKTYGNIVCFRDLEKETEEAIALFGDREADSVVLLKSFKDYYNGYTDEKGRYHKGYKELIEELTSQFSLTEGAPITDQDKKNFISLFGSILRARNILSSFDEFAGQEILSKFDFQDYQSSYLDIYNEYRPVHPIDKKEINDDIVFEIELIKQVEVNIDYILQLVAKYHDTNCKDKELLLSIQKSISSSPELRSKKDLIINFIERLNNSDTVAEEWKEYIKECRTEDLNQIIKEERLKLEETEHYMDVALKDGYFKSTGSEFDHILPPVSRFGGKRKVVKDRVAKKLNEYYDKYFDIL